MKKITRMPRIIISSFLCIISAGSFAQVTVNSTGGTATASYTTLRTAFNAINAGTHTGTIAVAVSANTTETAPCVLNGSGAGAASYTAIAIAPSADGVTVSGATGSGRGLIELNGADNVTINGDNPNTAGTNRNLTIRNTAAINLSFTSCIRLATSTLVTSCDNVIMRNLNLNGSGVGRNTGAYTSEVVSWGVIASGNASTVSATTAPGSLTSSATLVPGGQTCTGLTISNNSIQTVSRGVSVNGSATSVAASLMISDNMIGNPVIGAADQVTGIGITAQGTSNGTISGNTVRIEGYILSSATNRAINVGLLSTAGVSGMIIEKNIIEKNYNNHVKTHAAIGIDISGGNNHVIRNNFVGQCINSQVAGTSTFNTTNGVAGIRILGGTGHQVYHNTVHLTGNIPGTTGKNIVAAFVISSLTATGLDVRNNIFSNQVTGGNPSLYNTVLVSVYLPSGATSAMNLTMNNNTYYQGSLSQGGIAQVGNTGSAANLYKAINFNAAATAPANNFRSYTNNLAGTGTNDNVSYASSNGTPVVAPTNLHISFASSEFTNIDQKGTASVGVLTDIDGDTRPSASTTNPDIGADEFTVPSCLAASGGTITPSSYSSCIGQTVMLTSTGATNAVGVTYQWMISSTAGGPYSNVTGGTGANTVSYTTPALTSGTKYYVLQTTCSFGPLTGLSNEVSVIANVVPVVTLSGGTSFCAGGSVLLTGTSGGTSQWYVNDSLIAGATSNTYAVTSPGTYNMIKTNLSGCSDSAASGITVSMNALPTVGAATSPVSGIVCSGTSAVLSGTGANTYAWTGGVTNAVSFVPASTATYTVTGTDVNGCMNTATATITVNTLPTVTAMASPTTVCAGDNATLTGMGASTYTWTGGVTDNVAFTPASTATYTVTGTDVNGCMNTGTAIVTVNTLPAVTAMASPAAVCAGDNTTFTGTGASGYTWTGGVTDNVAFSPASTATYTVTGTDVNGCMNTATATVTVNTLPVVTAMASPAAVCAGDNATLTGMGASSYTWTGGVTDNVAFAPASTATYTVTGTDVNGCMNTATVTVTVNSLPAVSFTPFTSPVCDDALAFTLSGGSPAGGSYSGTSVSGSMFDPTAAGAGMHIITYTVSDVNSCMGSDTASITVTVCTGLSGNTSSPGILIYPNPNNGTLTIEINNAGVPEMRISITDLQGKEVHNSVEQNMTVGYKKTISMDGIAKGIYYIRFSTATDVTVQKLIIQ
ncbi:MAG: C-terminal target protein [Bacteroidetes bacterium]|nr:C-terminal target protein [Bacteroidota bacterium]